MGTPAQVAQPRRGQQKAKDVNRQPPRQPPPPRSVRVVLGARGLPGSFCVSLPNPASIAPNALQLAVGVGSLSIGVLRAGGTVPFVSAARVPAYNDHNHFVSAEACARPAAVLSTVPPPM